MFLGIAVIFLQPLMAQQSKAVQEWQHQKYSMFIHWGAIYSTLGGVWDGKPVTRGYSEQIQSHAGIYSDTYAAVARQFNPQYWNADSIVLLAKAAGMRSVVITSKHHDGFCMFRSAYTDYNVADATPFKRDVIKELSDACRRHGLRFGLYFSLIDWHFPQAYPISSHNSDPITPEHHAYNKQQVTELLTNYGPISELWFDMGSQTEQQSRELADLVHRLQPNCMVSGRLGNDAGDFCVMGDNNYPDYKIAAPWQTPASVYDETWGYRSWQQHGKPEDKAREKLEGLIKVTARGGNYLLNIGPRGDGSVVDFEKDVLLRIGNWLQRNGNAIYGTEPNPFDVTFRWGEVTATPTRIYLHLLQVPENGVITLPGLNGRISAVTLVESGARLPCKIRSGANATEIVLPAGWQLNNDIRVLSLELGRGYSIVPGNLLPATGKGPLTLNRHNATRHYSISGVDYESYYRSTVSASWAFAAAAGSYTPVLTYSAQEKGRQLWLDIDGKKQLVTLNGQDSIVLNNHPEQMQWGPIYLAGPYWGGIDGTRGVSARIDPAKPWPNEKGRPWALQATWKNDVVYTPESDPSHAFYLLQEITSPEAQPYLVQLTSGDGIQVFLNGEEQTVHNNPVRGATQQEVLLLPLQKGKNQLLVKYYNRFAKKTSCSIGKAAPQVLYRQTLPAQALSKQAVHHCSVIPVKPVSVHRDMRLEGLEISLNR